MKRFQLFNKVLPGLLLLFGLHAAASAVPQPVAASTIDVCQNELTGDWRYSGVVAVGADGLPATLVARVDNKIQNMLSTAGYVDALTVDTPVVATAAAESKTIVAAYSSEAAPLPLGVLRSNALVRFSDPFNPGAPPMSVASTAELVAGVCGCGHPTGCVHTQGYWKSKPGVIWPAPYSRDALFFSSGLTWQQILDTPPKGGNGYIILAHQVIAAVLNRASGASAPPSVQTIINNATAYFSSGATLESCGASACATQKTWAAILDTYNNGNYPGAPGHCPD